MRKSIFTFITLAFLGLSQTHAQVGIGTTAPNASSILDLDANNKGFLPPRMNTNERDAISNPADGLVIFNTTTGSLNYYNAGWFEMKGSAIEGLVECNAINIGRLEGNTAASGVVSKIVYAKSNGTAYDALTIQSTGVTGLTATLDQGTFNTAGGELEFTISGTPSGSAGGDAVFAITIGGQSCFHKRVVEPLFICGTSTVTSTYDNVAITYGTISGPNSTCWLDRNLGATSVFSGGNQIQAADYGSLGGLYQWGRSDDGHQKGSYVADQISNNLNFQLAIDFTNQRSATLFPTNPATITEVQGAWSNWFDDQNPSNQITLSNLQALWYDSISGTIGPSNPCPVGWRVPTYFEFNGFYNSGSNNTKHESIPAFGNQMGQAQTPNILVVNPQNTIGYHTSDLEYFQNNSSTMDNIRTKSFQGNMTNPQLLRNSSPIRCIRH
jgi:hypothetical protein